MQVWNELVLVHRTSYKAGEQLDYRQRCHMDDNLTIYADEYLNDDGVATQDFDVFEFEPRRDSYLWHDLSNTSQQEVFGNDIKVVAAEFTRRNLGYVVYEAQWSGDDVDTPEYVYVGVLDTESLAIYVWR